MTQHQRPMTITGKSAGDNRVRLGRWRPVARCITIGYLLLVAVLPFLGLIVVALQPFWQATIDPRMFTLDAVAAFFTSGQGDAPQGLGHVLQLGTVGATLVMFAATILVTYAYTAPPSPAWEWHPRRDQDPGGHLGPGDRGRHPVHVRGTAPVAQGIVPDPAAGVLGHVDPRGIEYAATARGQVGDDLLEASAMSGGSRTGTSLRILWPLMRPGTPYGWAIVFRAHLR